MLTLHVPFVNQYCHWNRVDIDCGRILKSHRYRRRCSSSRCINAFIQLLSKTLHNCHFQLPFRHHNGQCLITNETKNQQLTNNPIQIRIHLNPNFIHRVNHWCVNKPNISNNFNNRVYILLGSNIN